MLGQQDVDGIVSARKRREVIAAERTERRAARADTHLAHALRAEGCADLTLDRVEEVGQRLRAELKPAEQRDTVVRGG